MTIYTTAEAARLLKISRSQVVALIRAGKLSAAVVGLGGLRRTYRISQAAIDELLIGSEQHGSRKYNVARGELRVNRFIKG